MLLTAGGLAAAFSLAACCGLPLILAGLGLGSAWLSGIGLAAAPHRHLLIAVAALLLAGGAAALWRQHRAARACAMQGVCAKPAARLLTLAGLVLGFALLVLGYVYV
jgi:mercuric ion transport protein